MTDSQDVVAVDMSSRLEIYKYDKITFSAAIRGETIPQGLALPLARLCVVRGIRYHDGFGEELRGILPLFTRALNARSIMSNRIPDMDDVDHFPYCIWYPETASKETYRKLVHRYPQMAYQVGRACAVAEYIDLYEELDILPEIHIAEEARECGAGRGTVREEVKEYGIVENVVDYGAGNGGSEAAGRVSDTHCVRGSMAVYDNIMAQPIRYDIMNDYELTIRTDPIPGAYLNGDTAVRRFQEIKQQFGRADVPEGLDEDGEPIYGLFANEGFRTNTFNITEDMNIEDMKPYRNTAAPPTPEEAISLLSTPLPRDLPTVDKDLLIRMAAYYGDIDRYVRLRRPKPIEQEEECCIRGIYHNTMFALWWQRQESTSAMNETHWGYGITTAITARMIMNNVLSRMMTREHWQEPYLIWYPALAMESTYRELFRLRPSMAPQILRACIEGGRSYQTLFSEVLATIEPDVAVAEAAADRGGFFKDSMDQRIREIAGRVRQLRYDHWKRYPVRGEGRVSSLLRRTVGIPTGQDTILWDGSQCDLGMGGIELLASVPHEWKKFEGYHVELDYVEWPPKTEDTGDAKRTKALEKDVEYWDWPLPWTVNRD